MLLAKLIIVILLVFIVISLFVSCYFLAKDPSNADSRRLLRGLTIRISLSIIVIIFIGIAIKTGLITPHG